VRRRHQAQVRKWRKRRVSPSAAFRPILPVHMTDLEGALRVDSGCRTDRSAGTKRKIYTTRFG
jgi:hypothetical protein